jgi:hypothetical protein
VYCLAYAFYLREEEEREVGWWMFWLDWLGKELIEGNGRGKK